MTSSLSSRGCHGSLSWVSTSPVWSSGCFWLLGAGSRPVVPLRSLVSSHSGVFVRCELGPPLFPRSLRRSLASCLVALPFASLPLVSRPWTVLCWSHLMSLSSVGDRFVVVPRQLCGLEGCSPASPNCPPSRVRKQRSFGFSASLSLRVFAMRSPYWVESVSVLDRNEGSSWCLVGAFAIRSPLRVESFSDLDWNKDSLRIFPRVW